MTFLTFNQPLNIEETFLLSESKNQHNKPYWIKALSVEEAEKEKAILAKLNTIFDGKNRKNKVDKDKKAEELLQEIEACPMLFLHAILNNKFSVGDVIEKNALKFDCVQKLFIKMVEMTCTKEIFNHYQTLLKEKRFFSGKSIEIYSFLVFKLIIRHYSSEIRLQEENEFTNAFLAIKKKLSDLPNYKYFLLVCYDEIVNESSYQSFFEKITLLDFLKTLSYQELNYAVSFKEDLNNLILKEKSDLEFLKKYDVIEEVEVFNQNLCLFHLKVQILNLLVKTNNELKEKLIAFKDKLIEKKGFYKLIIDGKNLYEIFEKDIRRFLFGRTQAVKVDLLYTGAFMLKYGRFDQSFSLPVIHYSKNLPFIFNGEFIEEKTVLDAVKNIFIYFKFEQTLTIEQRLTFLQAHSELILAIAKFLLEGDNNKKEKFDSFISSIKLKNQDKADLLIIFFELYMKCFLNGLIEEKIQVHFDNIFLNESKALNNLYLTWGIFYLNHFDKMFLHHNVCFLVSNESVLLNAKSKNIATFIALSTLFYIANLDIKPSAIQEKNMLIHVNVLFELLFDHELQKEERFLSALKKVFEKLKKEKFFNNLSKQEMAEVLKKQYCVLSTNEKFNIIVNLVSNEQSLNKYFGTSFIEN